MKVIVNSVPKSGTHLVASVLREMGMTIQDHVGLTGLQRRRTKKEAFIDYLWPNKVKLDLDDLTVSTAVPRCNTRLNLMLDKQFAVEHLPYTPSLENTLANNQIQVVCIIRDPRAVLWSWYHHMLKYSDYQFYEEMNDPTLTLEEKLMIPILGCKKEPDIVLASLVERYRRFLPWKRSNIALWTHFEELIGPQGGGDEVAQVNTVARIAKFIGNEDDATRIAASIFGKNAWTFRAGKVDEWKESLPASIIEKVDHEFASIYAELGYQPLSNIR